MQAKAVLTVSNLHKSYANHAVLAALNLHVRCGQTVGLIGANGAGKTTLFKCLLDVCRPEIGDIAINGTHYSDPSARREIAFLPENFQAPYYMTGRQFIRSMLTLHRTPYQSSKIDQILQCLDFDRMALDRRVRTYSKGMTQKLGLTVCLASDKPVTVMDEPMSGLDPKSRHALATLLIERKRPENTMIFSTHLLQDIETICDHIAMLSAGQIVFFGSIPEALTQFQASDLEQAYLNSIAG